MRRPGLLPLLAILWLPNISAAAIRVAVEGVDGERRENVLAMLSINEYRQMDDLTEPMVRRLHARAPGEIRRALMPFGHYNATVESSIRQAGEDWETRYLIDPGPRVRINDVSINIAGDAEARAVFSDIVAGPPFRRGEPLRHQVYEDFKRQLLNRANDSGYLDAQFTTQRLAVNTQTLTADIELELAPGEQFRFGDIAIEQDILDDDFVRRYMTFESGDPVNYNQLLDLQYALTDSEYFSIVNIHADRERAENRQVPVNIIAQENRRSRYTAGLGYGTDTGPRLSLGFQRRYVNRRGHRLAVETMFSEVENSFSSRYTIPLADPARERLQLAAGTIRQERGDAESRRLMLGISRVQVTSAWEQTLYLRAERENSLLPDRDFTTRILLPGASWQRTRADDVFYTRNGYRLFADVRASHPSLGSDTEFVRLQLLSKRIFPLGDRWRLLLRAEAGAAFLADSDELPVSQRFFTGGDQTVRGYDFNRLATLDADGNVVGGRYMASGSAEIEYRFAENWAVAAFSDAGNAMDDWDTSLETAYGTGVRWISPVGVLRIDVARPVDRNLDAAGSFRLHISIGPDL